ncbi:MAG TPA: wax ester/triacylglycerol synthase family O-acyltransferase [Myxococcaceae bacterium]|nr:wax ester/triacylglycerol synthase family O-acyltransferase [Myxococcaceae bacterium]
MRTPLANVDASWLRMDEPSNPMVVTGVLVLETPVSVRRVRSLLQRRLLRFERFRQRIVHPFAGVGLPSWEEDPRFSIDQHLVVEKLSPPADEAALQDLLGALATRPFPTGRPPWRVHLVPHYRGGSAIIVRIHHCIGDGLALVHVLLSLADQPAELRMADEVDPPRPSPWSSLRATVSTATRALPDGAGHLVALGRLLLLPPDPVTCFKGKLGMTKRLVWSRAFHLEDFKRIGRATSSTVNDVLMAALAGALRRYLLEHGTVERRLDVRGVVPVNLRRANEAHLLGNRFGLVFLQLPLSLGTPRARLAEVRRRMRLLKETPGAAATFELLWLMGLAPRPLFDAILDLFATKATAVVTNVIGPRESISILGSRLRQAMFWVPCAGHLGLGISLLSYAGQVWVGVHSDAGLIPDPERIISAFEEELDALRVARPARRSRGRKTVPVPAGRRRSRGPG